MGTFTDHPPHVVEVETTTYCNRRCSYCPNITYDRGQRANEVRMPVDLWRKIVEDLGANHYAGQFGAHRYGEPLSDERMPDLLAIARAAMPNARIALYTNGDYLTPHLWDRLLPSIDHAVITQHGPAMPAGVRAILDAAGGRHPKIRYRTSTTILARASNRAGLVDIPFVQRRACSVVMTELHIDAHGDLMLCCEDYLGRRTFGNIAHMSIEEAWSSPDRIAAHRGNLVGDWAIPACKGCGYFGAAHADAVLADQQQESPR